MIYLTIKKGMSWLNFISVNEAFYSIVTKKTAYCFSIDWCIALKSECTQFWCHFESGCPADRFSFEGSYFITLWNSIMKAVLALFVFTGTSFTSLPELILKMGRCNGTNRIGYFRHLCTFIFQQNNMKNPILLTVDVHL